MHGNNLPLSVVAAAIDACAHESERLNSERIADRFGSYGIDVCIVGSALFQRGRDASKEVDLVKARALRGFDRVEFEAFGVPGEESAPRFREAVSTRAGFRRVISRRRA